MMTKVDEEVEVSVGGGKVEGRSEYKSSSNQVKSQRDGNFV